MMAKLLIHTKAAPRHPTDEKVNAGQFQPGDVILILEDDEQFCSGDVGPWNTVVEVPGVKRDDLIHLTTPDVKTTMEMDPETLEIKSTDELLKLRQWNANNLDALKLVSGTIDVQKGQELAFVDTYFKQTLKADETVEVIDG